MTAALSPIMSTGAALTVALLSRAVTTAVDVGAAGLAGLLRSGVADGGEVEGSEGGAGLAGGPGGEEEVKSAQRLGNSVVSGDLPDRGVAGHP